ncbi:MAG: hypothetical protein WDZ59_10890 [Pirellulales bacterium]
MRYVLPTLVLFLLAGAGTSHAQDGRWSMPRLWPFGKSEGQPRRAETEMASESTTWPKLALPDIWPGDNADEQRTPGGPDELMPRPRSSRRFGNPLAPVANGTRRFWNATTDALTPDTPPALQRREPEMDQPATRTSWLGRLWGRPQRKEPTTMKDWIGQERPGS